MSKTVYILGAGFSKSADAPLQSEIIKDIFELKQSDFDNYPYGGFSLWTLFSKCRDDLEMILSKIFFLSSDEYNSLPLEDVFSSIDKSLANNKSLRNITPIQLYEIRRNLNALIIILMKIKLPENLRKTHIRKFSKFLVMERSRNIAADPFTIISTNWDIILENALLPEMNLSKGDIDYCFYTHSFKGSEFGRKLRSGLFNRGLGKYNLKVLKLHGSMNWLQCQRCQRIYITFFDKIALEEFLSKPECVHCKNNSPGDNESFHGPLLSSMLIMPTFLKDMNNYNLKLIWQIAGIELQEATDIVFMGYSFPLADFEFRHLLVNSVRKNAKIKVVLCGKDIPNNETYKYLPEIRYRSFFGDRINKDNVSYEGVESYINNNCAPEPEG